ncbi:PLP-dependent transferase [Candidatus Parcubacteria bacterium]|nr:MAG: PLP-dependent transferase [Candidatus Parcubacteria bacterium]
MKRKKTKEEYRMRTHLIHGNFESKKWDYNHHVNPPMSASAMYRLSSAQRGAQGFFEFANETIDETKHIPIYIYDRLEEPSRGMLEENLAYAEGGEMCLTFTTGMAAISAAVCTLCERGHEIVAHHVTYGCTYSLFTNWLPRFGIRAVWTDFTDEASVRRAITEKTRVLYFESPVNPTLTVIDIAAIRKIADEVNRGRPEEQHVKIVVDNTFATPYCQRPLEHGADFSVQSLTKGVSGFGTDMGGAVVGPMKHHSKLLMYRKDFGGVLSPRSAWIFLVYGLPSLATRFSNQIKTAQHVAKFLREHPKIDKVVYPGFEDHPQYEVARRQMTNYEGKFAPGNMIYFTLKDAELNGKQSPKVEKFIDYLADHAYCITLAVSLGYIKTLVENAYSMTHAAMPEEEKRRLGMEPGGIRLSVGLEDWHDIIEDLRDALEHVL